MKGIKKEEERQDGQKKERKISTGVPSSRGDLPSF
jgi:hypothetical protein